MGVFCTDKTDVGLIVGPSNKADSEAASELFANLLLFVRVFNTAIQKQRAGCLLRCCYLLVSDCLLPLVKDHSLVFVKDSKLP